MGNSVTINTDYIPVYVVVNAGVAYATAQPIPTATPANANAGGAPGKRPHSEENLSSSATPAPPAPVVSPPEHRSFTITIPQDVSPGQTLPVVAPDGRTIEVVLGPSSTPGSQLTIAY